MSLRFISDHDLAKCLVEFGEAVATHHADLPPLPGDGFCWRLVVQIEGTVVQFRWVAEPCEVKQ